MRKIIFLLLLVALVIAGALIQRQTSRSSPKAASKSPRTLTPLEMALIPQQGEDASDREIRALQDKIRQGQQPAALLEQLGWAFIAKARLSSDPGFYDLAEQSARALLDKAPKSPAGLLLLGHIYDAEHRFAAAEKIARQLTAEREFVFDYALLGDALMEQGKLEEAVIAYQKMVDLKPCLQTYSRVAYMRWLKGDLLGAIGAAGFAVSAGGPREPEATAWAHTRLAFYQIQAGDYTHAENGVDRALQLAPNYAPALLMRGRLLLARGRVTDSLEPLREAAKISPLPDYLWTLSEALHAGGQTDEAAGVDAKLEKSGQAGDPRTFALFLSSRRDKPELALRLATAELETRKDVFTYDALAWAELANGQVEQARENSQRALAEGTQDARLFYHAGVIAASVHDTAGALKFLNQARAIEQTLLPSERTALGQTTASLLAATPQFSSQ
ncbi:MAG: tetratricopeptide repeat protein [Chthoniobacterales bacterium]